MERIFIADKTFDKVDFTQKPFQKGDYECCKFVGCNFSSIDLSYINFTECEFIDCNLTMVKLTKASFRDANFKGCKMLGLHFESCSDMLLSFSFEGCTLNLSSFYKLKIKKTWFKDCSIQEVDFSESDLSESLFENCDLTRAIYDRSIIEKVDFSTSYGYSINPEKNRIKKAKFSINGIPGLLQQYDIEIV